MWAYNDELQIKFTFRSGPIIFGRVMALGLWNLAKYLVVSPLYFTMIWDIDLIFWYECIIISYRSTLKLVPVEWYFANLVVGLWNLATYLVVTTFFTDLRYWLDFWYVSVYWWVADQVWISLRLNDFGLTYTPWTAQSGVKHQNSNSIRRIIVKKMIATYSLEYQIPSK